MVYVIRVILRAFVLRINSVKQMYRARAVSEAFQIMDAFGSLSNHQDWQ